jgi:hypothetical protein
MNDKPFPSNVGNFELNRILSGTDEVEYIPNDE